MDNNNINNGDEAGVADAATEAETQAEAKVIKRRDLQLFSLLNRKDDLPRRTRNKLNELVKRSLDPLEIDVHGMLCDQNVGDNYQGLDSERDTMAEVATILQIFPNTLSKRKETKWDMFDREWVAAGDGEGEYPIQCVMFTVGTDGDHRFNFKAAPFIALLAQVAKELDQFKEQQRGGLLIEDESDENTLESLVISTPCLGEEYNQRIDTVCQTQLIQMQRMDLFKLEDILRYNLAHKLCKSCWRYYFAENKLRFLMEWCPSSLVHTDGYECLPLHYAARYSTTIQAFRIVFQYLIRYYPNKKGITILFTKNYRGETPFQLACMKHRRDAVMTIVENILNNSDIPMNTDEALFLAASNEEIDLDCVYFLLRREPHVLARLLPLGPNNNNNNGGAGDGDDDGGNHSDGNDDDDDDNNEDHNDSHLDDNNEDNDNDDNEDMNEGDGDSDDDDATDRVAAFADDDDGDDRNYSNSDTVRNNMHHGKDEEGDGDDDEDEMGDSTTNNEGGSRKRKG